MNDAKKPSRVGCGICGFLADDPAVLIDHLLTTGHVGLPTGVEGPGLAELVQMVKSLQAHVADPTAPLPPGVSIRRLDPDEDEDDE